MYAQGRIYTLHIGIAINLFFANLINKLRVCDMRVKKW